MANRLGRIARVVVVLLLACLVATPSLAQGGRARVRGKVLTEEGEPIANARITLRQPNRGTEIERATDERGSWAAAGLRGGQWQIDVIVEGYEPLLLTAQLSEGRRNPPIEVTLKRATGGATGYAIAESEKFRQVAAGADQAFQAGNYAEALRLYEELLAEFPKLDQLELNIGATYVRLRQYDAAIEHFHTYLEAHPGHSEALMRLGDAHILNGDSRKGLKYLDQVGLEQVGNPVLAYNMGEAYFHQGQAEKASAALQRAIALRPTFHEAYLQLGLVAINQRDLEAARQHLMKVIELAPDSPDAETARQILESIGQGTVKLTCSLAQFGDEQRPATLPLTSLSA